MLLDEGFDLALRPMKYPAFFEHYKNAVKNTWSVEEVPFSDDLRDLRMLSPGEQHMIKRLVAFFATGDQLVGNNAAMSFYKHLNSPEARMYLSRQLFEEAQHIHFYLTLLDTYVPDIEEREQLFAAVDTVPSIAQKAAFCERYTEPMLHIESLDSDGAKLYFLKNLLAYSICVEGIFFYAAFAYVYLMRSKGMLNALASGTDWVFRDESCHLVFAATVVKKLREEYPHLFTPILEEQVRETVQEAVACEVQFARDLLEHGVLGLSASDMTQYVEYVADSRLVMFGYSQLYGTKNPLTYIDLQDVQELANFFERTSSAYQIGGSWSARDMTLGEDF